MRRDALIHREQLISAAARVFVRLGARARLEAVLPEAGLGRGTLYRHFKNRSELAVAVLEFPLAELQRFVVEHQNDRTLLKAFLGRHRELAVIYQGCGMLATDPKAQAAFKALINRADRVYERVLERSIACGALSRTTTVERIRLATRMVFGAAETAAQDQKEQMTRDAIDLVCEGLQPIGACG